jgi:hypothetical protein
VQQHLKHIQDRAAIAARLCTRLTGMVGQLDLHDHPSAEQLFSILEEMAMLDGTIRSTTGLLVYDDLRTDIVDRLQSVTGLVTWFFLLLPGISFHVATPGTVKIDARKLCKAATPSSP